MAKRKKKPQSGNEYDEIIAQLKKTYLSDSDSDLEDSLLENSDKSDEDEEINRILNKIFASEKDADKKKDDIENTDSAFDNQNENEELPTAESANGIEEQNDPLVESAYDNEEASVESEEKFCESFDNKEKETLDENEDTVVIAQNEVDDVLNVMFGGAASSSTDLEPSEFIEETNVINEIVEDSFSGEKQEEDLTEVLEDELVEVDESVPIDEYENENSSESLAEEGFAVSDEEYDTSNINTDTEPESCDEKDTFIEASEEKIIINEEDNEEKIVIIPEIDGDTAEKSEDPIDNLNEISDDTEKPVSESICRLVLSPEEYTYDPLQQGLAKMGNAKAAKAIDRALDNEGEMENSRFDESDISLLLNLGYDDEIRTEIGAKVTEQMLIEKDSSFVPEPHRIPFGYCGKEFTSRSQSKEISEKYKTDRKMCLIRLLSVSVISLVILSLYIFFEFFSDRTSYPLVLMLEFLLIALICVVLHKRIYSGILGILKFEANLYSLSVFAICAYAIYSILTLIFYVIRKDTVDSSSLMLFGVTVSVYVIMTLVSDLLNCIKEANTFGILTKNDRIYTAEKAADTKSIFATDNNSGKVSKSTENVVKICNTSLISGYFSKTAQRKTNEVNLIYLLGIVPVLSLIIGCVSALVGGDIINGISTAMFTALLSTPIVYTFVPSFNEYIISMKLNRDDIAFIGTAAIDKYLKTEAITFDDKDAVEITSFKEIHPNNSGEIEKYVMIARKVFKSLGGTLSCLVENGVDEDDDCKVIINEINENGAELYFNESINILMGSKQYLKTHKIAVKNDTNLNAATKGNDCYVIYMAFDGVAKLGFIVNSKIKTDFAKTSSELETNGIRLLVESYEPHVNDLFFEQNKGDGNYSVSVIRPDELAPSQQRSVCDGDVISSCDGLHVAKAISYAQKTADNRRKHQRTCTFIIAAGIFAACVLALLINLKGTFTLFEWLRSHITLVFNVIMIGGGIPGVVNLFKLNKEKLD